MARFTKLELAVIRQALGALREDTEESIQAIAETLSTTPEKVEAAIASAHGKSSHHPLPKAVA